MQVQEMVRKLVKTLYRWIHLESSLWLDSVTKLKWYKPRLHYHSLMWKSLDKHSFECNTDGVSKENLGLSGYGFCLSNSQGNLIYARSTEVGNNTNTEIW